MNVIPAVPSLRRPLLLSSLLPGGCTPVVRSNGPTGLLAVGSVAPDVTGITASGATAALAATPGPAVHPEEVLAAAAAESSRAGAAP